MKDAGTAARLSCYALISALEADLRRWLADAFSVAGLTEFLHADLRKSAQVRRSRDTDAPPDSTTNDYNLLDYLDFADLGKLIFQHASVLPSRSSDVAQSVAHGLIELTPVRNRVCHSRPLELEDFSSVADFAKMLVSREGIDWRELRVALRTLQQNPASVLSVSIPSYWSEPASAIQHNLPIPEFEDTGFVGRVNDVTQVSKSLLGPYPVISIIGEGGLGKTALAVKVLYDLLDDPRAQSRFDIICWVSLKTSRLTPNGIAELKGALTTTLGLFQQAAKELGAPDHSAQSMKEALSEVLEYMREFRVLLAIDNVETVGSSEIVNFLRNLPAESKVLMTSRIGMGQIELPYPLVPLEAKDAIHLFRRAAKAQNLLPLVHAKQQRVEKWCRKLHFNPLAIKWFVSAVSLGKEPDQLVNPSGDDYKQLLKFSFDNLYDRLPEEAKQLVLVLSIIGTPATRTEILLVFATVAPAMPQDSIDRALILLHNASIIRRQMPREPDTATAGPLYSLTNFAAQFVRNLEAIPRGFFSRVQQAIRKVRDISENAAREVRYYKYNGRTIRARTREERLVSSIATQAIQAFDQGDLDTALAKLENAERLMSGFSEIHRLRAFMLSKSGDLQAARQEYDRALDCDPSSEIVRYSYALFLVHDLEDYDAALPLVKAIATDSPEDLPPRSLMALIETRRGNYQAATEAYEFILTSLGNDHPGKHRISLRDQAAAAYRRWSEQHLSYRDPTQFRRCIIRGLEILLDGLRVGDSDWRLERTLGEVCTEAIRGFGNLRDDAGATEFVQLLHRYREALPKAIGIRHSLERFGCFFRHIHGFVESLSMLPLEPMEDAPAVASRGSDDSRLVARVHSISTIGSYGYLETPDGEHWFFHRNHLRNRERWSEVSEGRTCTFSIGTNAKGPCAVEVELCDALSSVAPG